MRLKIYFVSKPEVQKCYQDLLGIVFTINVIGKEDMKTNQETNNLHRTLYEGGNGK